MRAQISSAILLIALADTALAQPLVATKAMCKSIGMQAYSSLNDDLGAGTIYEKLGEAGPQTSLLKCQKVFAGIDIAEEDKIKGESYIGDSTGSRSIDSGLGISFLKGIISKNSDAKVDASLKRGTKWEVKTNSLSKQGITDLRAEEYTLAASSSCANRIRAMLQKNKSATVSLVFQSAGTKQIEYNIEQSRSSGIDATLNIGPFISVNPKFKLDKPSTNKLNISSPTPINVCYVKKDWKIKSDLRSGANRFTLTRA